jgi:protein-tyrosine-phosphatase
MGGDNRESIAQSIARIVKHRKSEIDEGNIIIATVKEVYSDILDLDTFGTMDVILQPSEIEIPEIQLNAHVNNDGTTGISGKYTFPKVGSDIILIMDYRNGHEFYYPLFFSHVDKTFEQFDVEKTSKIVEVTTNDINDPYNTEETGKYSEETQTFEEIKKEVSDGSNTTTVTSQAGTHFIDTGEVDSAEPAVLGDSLKTILTDLSDAIKNITTQIPLSSSNLAGITTSNGGTLLGTTPPATQPTGSLSISSKNEIDNIVSRLDEFILSTVTLK